MSTKLTAGLFVLDLITGAVGAFEEKDDADDEVGVDSSMKVSVKDENKIEVDGERSEEEEEEEVEEGNDDRAT